MIPEKRRALMAFLAALMAAAVCVPHVGAAPPDPRLWIEPALLEVRPDARLEVQVMIEGIEDLGGFQLELAYDPSVLEVEEVALGDFLTSTGRTKIPMGPQIDNDGGVVALGAASFGEAPGAEGSGVLATITCRAQGEGSSALTLQDVQVLDTAAGAESVETEDGQVVVAATAAQQSAPTSSVRWGLIGAAAVLAVAGAAVLGFGILRDRSGEASDS